MELEDGGEEKVAGIAAEETMTAKKTESGVDLREASAEDMVVGKDAEKNGFLKPSREESDAKDAESVDLSPVLEDMGIDVGTKPMEEVDISNGSESSLETVARN